MATYREVDFEAGIQYARARYARAVAKTVQEDMERLVPVDTGELKSTIHTESVGDSVYITVGSDHWFFVEYGTSRMAAQPFIRPALARRRGVVDLSGTL